jgi:hypothetical protein
MERVGRARCLLSAAMTVAVLAGFSWAPGKARAAEKAIWGPVRLPGGTSAFGMYRDLGVDTYQMVLDWSSTAPSRPQNATDPADAAYRWSAEVDEAVRETGRRGIRIALLAQGSPAWANGGKPPIWAPGARDFGDFLTAASRRFPSVRRWMIWGEPNKAHRFQPNERNGQAGPRAYAPILDAAYSGLKRASRRNTVIGGMTWTGGDVKPARFLRWMRLPNGRPPRLDWFGHNPFPFRFPRLGEPPLRGGWRDISDVDTFAREVRSVYGRRSRLWLSEFTVQSDRKSRDFELFVSRRAQARWLTAAYRVASQVPSVAGLGWFGLIDEPERPGSANWGLITADGRRKPAYEAFRRALAKRSRPKARDRRRGPSR